MPNTVLHEVGSIKLGAESYRMVRTEQPTKRAWQHSFADEPPWHGGVPVILSDPQQTWHMGGLKSRQGIPGTSEYGKNTDTRFPFRLLPGPNVKVITLPGSVTTPTSIFEATGRIFVVAGRFVYTVAPSDDSVVQVKDFGATVKGIMGVKWELDEALITTDREVADADSLWKVTSGAFQESAFQGAAEAVPAFASGSVAFVQTTDVPAYRLAPGINRLFKVDKAGELRNILTGKDPLVNANWADQVQAGDKTPPPTGIVAYERTVFVGKAEGMFGVDTDGFGISLIKRIIKSADNGFGMEVWDPYVIYPHSRGTLRFAPGLIESMGLEQEVLNESPVKGVFTAFAPDQQWLYGALQVSPADTYILWARERPSLGPVTWDTWIYRSEAACKAMLNSALTTPPRVWFGHGNDIAYAKLSTAAGAPDPSSSDYEFALTGQRFSVKYKFEDWGSKDFPKIVLVGKNLTAARYWDLFYSVDGGAFSNLDVNGNGMRVDADGRKTFFLPTTVVGREVQFRYDYTGDVVTQGGELNFAEPFAVPRARKIPMYAIQLRLASDIRHDETIEGRSAVEQFNDLTTLLEKGAAVESFGPWGDKINVWVTSLRMVEVLQEGSMEPEFLVEALIQRREQA